MDFIEKYTFFFYLCKKFKTIRQERNKDLFLLAKYTYWYFDCFLVFPLEIFMHTCLPIFIFCIKQNSFESWNLLNFLWLTFNTNLQNMVFNCNLCSLSILFNTVYCWLWCDEYPWFYIVVHLSFFYILRHKMTSERPNCFPWGRTNLPSSQLFVSLIKCQLWIPKLILLGLRLISNSLWFLVLPWGIRDLSSLAGDGTCAPWQWKSRVLTNGPPGSPIISNIFNFNLFDL